MDRRGGDYSDSEGSENSVAVMRHNRGVTVADIPDLVNLIADFCDDSALSKLSRVNKLINHYKQLGK
jgi:hypothetical protein